MDIDNSSDSAFAQDGNEKSELTNAVAAVDPDYRYAYDFDDIGNRETSSERVTNFVYTANQLNQYTEISDSALFASPLRLTEDGFEPKVEGFSATNIALKDVLQLICESCDYCYVINSDGTLCFLPKYTESLIPTIRECESD